MRYIHSFTTVAVIVSRSPQEAGRTSGVRTGQSTRARGNIIGTQERNPLIMAEQLTSRLKQAGSAVNLEVWRTQIFYLYLQRTAMPILVSMHHITFVKPADKSSLVRSRRTRVCCLERRLNPGRPNGIYRRVSVEAQEAQLVRACSKQGLSLPQQWKHNYCALWAAVLSCWAVLDTYFTREVFYSCMYCFCTVLHNFTYTY